MATVFNPARTMNDLHHDVKAMVIDFLPNKERYTFVDLFPEIVNQTTVFDSRIKLKGGVIGKVNLFHKLRNVKTVILPDPWIGGPIPVFLKMTKAIFNGSNPNITSFLDSTGSLLMKSSDTRPKDNFMIEQMIDYISKVRKQNPDYDGSAVRNLFTGVKAYELVRKNPGIKIKLFADYEFVKNSNGNLVDEQIRNMIVGLRMRVIPPASRFLKQVPNMTRLRLDLGRFDLDPTTNFISSLDNLKYLELEFMNMSDSSKSLVEFMLNPPRNPNLKCFNVRSLNGDFSWILPSLQLDIRPGLKRLVFIGGDRNVHDGEQENDCRQSETASHRYFQQIQPR